VVIAFFVQVQIIVMPQSQLSDFFGAVRNGSVLSSACFPRHAIAPKASRAPGSVVVSDDDAPMVVARGTAKRSRLSQYEGEAEECSDDDEVGSSSDSFVVSDHVSESQLTGSPDVQVSLREICGSLRNRRQFVSCPQCLRLVRVILRFLSDVVECMPDT
jgi:hypothetical protein